MRTQLSAAVLVSTFPLLLALGGCDSDDAGAGGAGGSNAGGNHAGANDAGGSDAGGGDVDRASVTVDFAHLVDGAAVVLGTDRPYINAAGNEFGVSRVSYFVSLVTLTLADGTVVTAPGAHYVDMEMPETMAYALPVDAPAGKLAQISFVMGLPPALNVSGTFMSAPESLMEWPEPMGGGYHHMKLEGRYLNAASEPFNFMAHSGGLNGTDYSFEVVLDAADLSLTRETTLTVEMNLEEWFANPDTWDLNDYFNESHPGIMGDASALASLRKNGASVFTLGGQ